MTGIITIRTVETPGEVVARGAGERVAVTGEHGDAGHRRAACELAALLGYDAGAVTFRGSSPAGKVRLFAVDIGE